jgi:hypothetical protein
MDRARFAGGGWHPYVYVGNRPTAAIDPTGLWTWALDSLGRVVAISENNDTLSDLVEQQGYNRAAINAMATAPKRDIASKLKAGERFNVTPFLPSFVAGILKEQQDLDFDKTLRARLLPEQTKAIPKGKTIGSSGFDLMTPDRYKETDAGEVVYISKAPASGEFGTGTCFGFVGQCLGIAPPGGVQRINLDVTGLTGEKISNVTFDKPGMHVYPVTTERETASAVFVPPRGLLDFLTRGRAMTARPKLGAIGLFEGTHSTTKGRIVHAAWVLGRSQAGKVYVIQKLNSGQPFTVSPVDQLLQYYAYKLPVYWQ